MTTPVVFAFVTDPVGLGIVASAAKPGGSFTGITYSEATLGGKRLDLLLDALPGTRRVAVMWTRSFRENAAIFDAIRQAAQVRGVEVFFQRVRWRAGPRRGLLPSIHSFSRRSKMAGSCHMVPI